MFMTSPPFRIRCGGNFFTLRPKNKKNECNKLHFQLWHAFVSIWEIKQFSSPKPTWKLFVSFYVYFTDIALFRFLGRPDDCFGAFPAELLQTKASHGIELQYTIVLSGHNDRPREVALYAARPAVNRRIEKFFHYHFFCSEREET